LNESSFDPSFIFFCSLRFSFRHTEPIVPIHQRDKDKRRPISQVLKDNYCGWSSFQASALANIQCIKHLSSIYTLYQNHGVQFFSVNPGLVNTPCVRKAFGMKTLKRAQTIKDGIKGHSFVACSKHHGPKNFIKDMKSGEYWHNNGKEKLYVFYSFQCVALTYMYICIFFFFQRQTLYKI
jgi:hypothetical protein